MRSRTLAVLVVWAAAVSCAGTEQGANRTSTSEVETEVATSLRAKDRRTTSTGAADAAEPSASTVEGPVNASGPLRGVDWSAVLAADSRWTYQPQEPGASTPVGPRVTWPNVVAGMAVISSITFGDLDGDGNEEAVIPLASGGTAGGTGALVYTSGPSGPTLVGPDSFYGSFGYKTGAQVRKGKLQVSNVVGAGFEPNCCFSGLQTRTFAMVGGQLVQQGAPTETGVAAARPYTVEVFYQRINARQFEAAYSFLTAAAQAREPFAGWKAGFDTTVSVEASADATNGDDVTKPVRFTLRAIDKRPDGTSFERSFAGTWTLVYSTERHQWLLDVAEVGPI